MAAHPIPLSMKDLRMIDPQKDFLNALVTVAAVLFLIAAASFIAHEVMRLYP